MADPQAPTTTALFDRMLEAVERQREHRYSHGPVNLETRSHRLQRLQDLLVENRDALIEAMQRDFGDRSYIQTLLGDFHATLRSIRHAQRHLRRWMKPERRFPGFPMQLFGARAEVRFEAKGVVGIVGTWNFPINTLLAPMASALAAGNSALLKLPDTTPATSELLLSLTADYFTPNEVSGFIGDSDSSLEFAALPLDHLMFTGSTAAGNRIMVAAAKNLTPVTLELGGKSPVIISRRTDLTEAALRIAAGKMINAGQVCLAPDYVFVPREVRDEFVRLYEEAVEQLYPSLLGNPDYCSIIDAPHYNRLRDLITDAEASRAEVRQLNPANEDWPDDNPQRKLKPAVIVEPTNTMRVMQEELFGPLLCVKSYDDFERCIAFINRRPRPLALYYFGDDEYELKLVLDHTHSGGVTINDVLSHAGCEDLPFGGTGASGIGSYRGFDGFREFSHARAVYRQTRKNLAVLMGMLPPYDEKLKQRLEALIK